MLKIISNRRNYQQKKKNYLLLTFSKEGILTMDDTQFPKYTYY
jgi:hypothetical protein